MTSLVAPRLAARAQSAALLAVPSMLLFVGVLHFRSASDFFHFRATYEPTAPAVVVARLLAKGPTAPLFHDPHVLAYLGLPLVPLAAFALYALGRRARPLASLLALAVTLFGTVYLGGLFGMWTAFYHGIAGVDPRYADGATATFAALTAPRGAFWLTTTLAKLAMIGLALQLLSLVRVPRVPVWAPLVAAAGCLLVLAFWDQDNWMMIGEALLLTGAWPLSRLRGRDGTHGDVDRTRERGAPGPHDASPAMP